MQPVARKRCHFGHFAASCSVGNKLVVAQVLAKEAGATFINIRASSIQSKWFGESQKAVSAIFSLAYKCQPCIIFIGKCITG